MAAHCSPAPPPQGSAATVHHPTAPALLEAGHAGVAVPNLEGDCCEACGPVCADPQPEACLQHLEGMSSFGAGNGQGQAHEHQKVCSLSVAVLMLGLRYLPCHDMLACVVRASALFGKVLLCQVGWAMNASFTCGVQQGCGATSSCLCASTATLLMMFVKPCCL